MKVVDPFRLTIDMLLRMAMPMGELRAPLFKAGRPDEASAAEDVIASRGSLWIACSFSTFTIEVRHQRVAPSTLAKGLVARVLKLHGLVFHRKRAHDGG